jgi:hypothetical protein
MECENEEQLNTLKERAMKCKLIALDKMDKHPLCNPSYFNKRDKARVIELMTEWFSKEDEEINKWFNDIVNDRILANGLEYQNYPVYDLSKKDLEEIEVDVSTN